MLQSRSRYKRSKNATKVDVLDGSRDDTAPQISGQEQTQSQNEQDVSSNNQPREKKPIARYHKRPREQRVENVAPQVPQVDTARIAEENRRVQEKERAAEAQRKEDEVKAAEQILAEQKRQDLKRLEAELEAASPSDQTTSPREKFGFLSRKFGTTKTLPTRQFQPPEVPAPQPIVRARTQRITKKIISAPQVVDAGASTEPVKNVVRKEEVPVKEAPSPVKQGGLPQMDAPVSAINAGERVSQGTELVTTDQD